MSCVANSVNKNKLINKVKLNYINRLNQMAHLASILANNPVYAAKSYVSLLLNQLTFS